jgi:hypothetical protein
MLGWFCSHVVQFGVESTSSLASALILGSNARMEGGLDVDI